MLVLRRPRIHVVQELRRLLQRGYRLLETRPDEITRARLAKNEWYGDAKHLLRTTLEDPTWAIRLARVPDPEPDLYRRHVVDVRYMVGVLVELLTALDASENDVEFRGFGG